MNFTHRKISLCKVTHKRSLSNRIRESLATEKWARDFHQTLSKISNQRALRNSMRRSRLYFGKVVNKCKLFQFVNLINLANGIARERERVSLMLSIRNYYSYTKLTQRKLQIIKHKYSYKFIYIYI